MSSMSAYESRRNITAGGRVRQLTKNCSDRMMEYDIVEEQVAHTLDNWALRGIDNTPDREPTYVHFAYIPEHDKVLKVVTSIDDERIVTTHFHTQATKAFKRGDHNYFVDKYQDLEQGNESYL